MVFLSALRLSVAKRIPLIRFRKGGYQYNDASSSSAAPASMSSESVKPQPNVAKNNQFFQICS